ncbi:MAG: hypothetical protein WA115_05440 [Polynucleobacter sp.]
MNSLKYSGKVKGLKTFKEHEQERFLQSMVLPASELAKTKQEKVERAEAFTRAADDEEFVNGTQKSVSLDWPSPIGRRVGVVTREPFEDLP